MGTSGRLLTIGEFSRRSRLPASTLRYYHQRGLLEPAYVDPATGYRHYSPTQLVAASLVNELRRAGVRPEIIAEIADGDTDIAALIVTERRRIEAEMQERVHALATLDRLVDRLATGTCYLVSLDERGGRTVPTECGEVDSQSASSGVQRLMVRLRRRLRALRLTDTGGYGAMFPLDLATDPMPVSVFASVAVPEGVSVPTIEIPASGYAATDHTGDHAVGPAYEALLDWIGGNGIRPTGPVIEEYLGDRREPRTRISIGVAP